MSLTSPQKRLLSEANTRCDACQKKDENLRKVPELPVLKFCSGCWRRRVEILLKARNHMRFDESVFDEKDRNWKEFFKNLNPDDVKKLKNILITKKGFWTELNNQEKEEEELNHDSADFWKPKPEPEPEPDNLSTAIDKHNAEAAKNIENQNQRRTEVKQRIESEALHVNNFMESVFDQLKVAIQHRYPGVFGSKVSHIGPAIYYQKNGFYISMIVNSGSKYLVIGSENSEYEYEWNNPRWKKLGEHPRKMKIAQNYTSPMFEIWFDDKKIVRQLRRQIRGWLERNPPSDGRI